MEEPTIAFLLSEWIQLHLGDSYYREIPKTVADGIMKIPRWNEYCHIQYSLASDWRDEKIIFRKLPLPLLWYKHRWVEDYAYNLHIKAVSEQERILRRIEEVNIKIITAAVIRELGIEGEGARSTAVQLLRKKKFMNIKALGVAKLITKEEELI